MMGAHHLYESFRQSLQKVKVTNLLLFILLLSSVDSAKPLRCQVDKCSNKYRETSETQDVDEKCRLLNAHRNCLEKMEIQCRGSFMYHTSLTVNERATKDYGCINRSRQKQSNAKSKNQCNFAGKSKYKFCSVFGDPHVRTFSDKFHTCKANGTWTLIHNDYVVVKATNSLLQGGMEATAISKLMVFIKDSGSCAHKKTYIAEVGEQLPVTFTDGTQHSGVEKSVNLSEVELGKQIQIEIRFIATTIVVRNVGTHLSFSIQMPEEIVKSPIDRKNQMCIRGCPKRQRIRLTQEIERLTLRPKPVPKQLVTYSEHDARKRCRDILLNESRLEIEEEDNTETRTKRNAPELGEKTPNKNRNRRKQNGRRELDPAATTWMQISHSDTDGDDEFLRAFSRSKKIKKRNRHSPGHRRRRKFRDGFMRDDPRPGYNGKSGRRERGGGDAISNVVRGKNFYFEACVFDLMTTGDITYASSARGAFSDVTRFHKEGENARGASKEIINSWKYIPTSSLPQETTKAPVSTSTTKASVKIRTTTSGANRSTSNINILLLIICLIFSSNFIQIGTVMNVHKIFFNIKTKT
ncbi:uncharacterized protein LOC120346093 isoform X2 [Styela clava]